MRNYDLSPLYRTTVGFDRLFSMLDSLAGAETGGQSYPPYNIERTGENAYRITMAVAGFAPEDVTITAQPNLLVVSGRKQSQDDVQYLHHGLAMRAFERRFNLDDYMEVKGASMEHGLLSLDLACEVPEAMKPRRIEIATGGGPRTIEHDQAA